MVVSIAAGKANTRPYQEEALTSLLAARSNGLQRVLFTMPTGTGKTFVFCWLIERLPGDGPTLILAHRDELIRQAAERVESLIPGANIAVEKAGEYAGPMADVVVASVQTIGRRNTRRLDWLATMGPRLIICDEAHHAPAVTYGAVFERFGAFSPNGSFLVGCTATPHRLDKVSMGTVFQAEVYRYEIRKAIDDGWLAPIRAFRVVTETDLGDVRTVQGDFEVGALSRAVNTRARTEQVIEHWRDVALASCRPTLAFCVDVEHAHDTAKRFREAGFAAEAVDGQMGMTERSGIIARLRAGETQIVCNCQILTEGFDYPAVSCVIMLRPTQSQALYVQMAGRGTRISPNKADCTIIDVVDNCVRHNLITAPCLIGLPSQIDLEGGTVSEAMEAYEGLGAGAERITGQPVTLTQMRTRLEQWDVFRQCDLPGEVDAVTVLAWAPVADGFYLSAGDGGSARIVQDMVGEYHLLLGGRTGELRKRPLGRDLGHAFREADLDALGLFPPGLIRRDQSWRSQEASEKQKWLLLSKGVSPEALAGITKGEAARAITRLLQMGPR